MVETSINAVEVIGNQVSEMFLTSFVSVGLLFVIIITVYEIWELIKKI